MSVLKKLKVKFLTSLKVMKLLFHNNLKNATRCESKIRLQKKRGLQHFIEHLLIRWVLQPK